MDNANSLHLFLLNHAQAQTDSKLTKAYDFQVAINRE